MHADTSKKCVYVVLERDVSEGAPGEVLTRMLYIVSEVNHANFKNQIESSFLLCDRSGHEALYSDVRKALEGNELTVAKLNKKGKKVGGVPTAGFEAWFRSPPENVVYSWAERDGLHNMISQFFPALTEGGISPDDLWRQVDSNNDERVTSEEIQSFIVKVSIPAIDHENSKDYPTQVQELKRTDSFQQVDKVLKGYIDQLFEEKEAQREKQMHALREDITKLAREVSPLPARRYPW